MNTDSCTATFEKQPMSIKKYFWDDDGNVPKYKLEIDANGKVKQVDLMTFDKKGDWQRHESYEIPEIKYNIIKDPDISFDGVINDFINNKKGLHVDGRAGTGKTWLIRKIIEKLKENQKKYIVLSPTNKASRLIGGVTIHLWYTQNRKHLINAIAHLDCIIIDEISMIPEIFYKLFLTIKKNNNKIKILMAGDFEQLPPVNDRVENCDYRNSRALYEITDGNRLELSRCRRSDKKVFEKSLNVDAIQPTDFKKTFQYSNICHYNITRHRVNLECMTKYVQFKIGKKCSFLNCGPSDAGYDIIVVAGTPIISKINNKTLDIQKNSLFEVKNVNTSLALVIVQNMNGGDPMNIKKDEFNSLFDLAYCITVYKCQGETFDEPYMIHDWDRMSPKGKYVAFTRAKTLKQIHFKY